MCDSALFARARGDRPSLRSATPRHQLSAKLHCLHGAPIEEAEVFGGREVYPYACSMVYDLRNYTDKTGWGPFAPDGSGRVDWEMMEAITVVLGHNLRQCRVFQNVLIQPLWSRPFAGIAPNSHVLSPSVDTIAVAPSPRPRSPIPGPVSSRISAALAAADEEAAILSLPSMRENPPPPLADPYGITGTWMRVVCFLDYTELFAYNFTSPSLPPGEPRPPLSTDEAIRMIVMHVHITRIEAARPDDCKEIGDTDRYGNEVRPGDRDERMPVVHFGGTSRPRYAYWDPNATANVKGSVYMTKEGEVRWTTFSVYHGEERWRSEGIQLGGVKSARGVVGCWFDKYVLWGFPLLDYLRCFSSTLPRGFTLGGIGKKSCKLV